MGFPPQQPPCPLATVLSLQRSSPFCHPERTRISYSPHSPETTYVVLPKENHMQLTEATTLDRKIRGSRGICGSSGCNNPCRLPLYFNHRLRIRRCSTCVAIILIKQMT